jgi:hypothetical protein
METVTAYEMYRFPKRIDADWVAKSKTLPQSEKRREYGSDISQYHQTGPRLTVCRIRQEQVFGGEHELFEKFNHLMHEWREQAENLSSITAIAMLPSYQEIIGMGKPALPLILNELKERHDHLFWALRFITGTDPVQPEDRGHIDRMAETWIEWGRKNKIIE